LKGIIMVPSKYQPVILDFRENNKPDIAICSKCGITLQNGVHPPTTQCDGKDFVPENLIQKCSSLVPTMKTIGAKLIILDEPETERILIEELFKEGVEISSEEAKVILIAEKDALDHRPLKAIALRVLGPKDPRTPIQFQEPLDYEIIRDNDEEIEEYRG
jgi:hypothetical protein